MDEIAIVNPAPVAAAPVSEKERLKIIDALRGVALLGILLMNIPGFAMPNYFSESFKSDPANVNFWVSAVISVVFEGKMRALFGMIFGAGVLLFVSKKEAAGRSVTGLFYRRMFWLVLFGLIHAAFDLMDWRYPLSLWLLRHDRVLVPEGEADLSGSGRSPSGGRRFHGRNAILPAHSRRAHRLCGSQRGRGGEQTTDRGPERRARAMAGDRKNDAPEPRRRQGKYAENEVGLCHRGELSAAPGMESQTIFMPIEIWDSLALMLLGMALYQWGFLSGQWSNRAYGIVMAIGYGVGVPLATYSFFHGYVYSPNHEASLRRMELVPIEWVGLIYPFQRIFLVMAHVATLIILYKSRYAQTLFRSLEAVGRMAFTNYIMHSVICTLFFFGYGLNYYAELEFYQIYFVVFAIWILQLIASPLWLRYFLFGPLEWVWRSLTYWKMQPFMRRG